MKAQRVQKVLDMMKKDDIAQAIISDSYAIFYLTGLKLNSGERLFALLLDSQGDHKLFINELFPLDKDYGVEPVVYNDTEDSVAIVASYVKDGVTIGVDKNWPARFLLGLMGHKEGNKFINVSYIIDNMRMVKDAEEIELMKKSSKINDNVMERLIKEILDPKKSEIEMADELVQLYKEVGCEGVSFDPIIGIAANGANPHGEPGDRYMKEGDAIILDIGGLKDSYCSDMTRTVFYKSVPEKGKEVYNIVREACERGIAKVKPGVKLKDVDAACRDYITEKGYGPQFTHRTGHMCGLEDHDFGDVSSVSEIVAEPGMIFSIEPGIYLQGEFGVRVEDLVLVTEDGCESLNSFTKDIIVID